MPSNPDLNEEYDIRMEGSNGGNCWDIDEYGEDKSNIYALGWDIYTRDKEELIKREFLVYVLHPKWGDVV